MEEDSFSYWKPTLCCNKKSKSGPYSGIFGICLRNSLAARVKCSWKDQMLAANDLNPSPCHCKAFTVGYLSNILCVFCHGDLDCAISDYCVFCVL